MNQTLIECYLMRLPKPVIDGPLEDYLKRECTYESAQSNITKHKERIGNPQKKTERTGI
ncbi:MAG: hypothetical protein IJH65_04350 [Methanobrevibacter sp.]|nr:hypothetical protein [Methanobrevibacter sp.]